MNTAEDRKLLAGSEQKAGRVFQISGWGAGGDTGEGRMEVANPGLLGQSRGLLGAALEAATEVGGSQPAGPGEFEGQPR